LKISEVDHIAVTVSNINNSLKFYQEVLGFEMWFDLPLEGKGLENLIRVKKGTRLRTIMLRQKGSNRGMVELIEFNPPAVSANKSKKATAPGFLLLSFQVLNEKLEDVCLKLEKKGVTVYSKPQPLEFKGIGIVKAVVLEDPDGNMIELIQMPNK